MLIRVHKRVNRIHPEIKDEDAIAALENSIRAAPREGTSFPPEWVGIGIDMNGRLLQYVAVNLSGDEWLIFHAMAATRKVLNELGVGR